MPLLHRLRAAPLLAALLACVLALSLAACDMTAPFSDASPFADAVTANAAAKTAVCHSTGDQDNPFVLIDVADAALPVHVEHGDASPGEAVPGMSGYDFDEACQPVPASVSGLLCTGTGGTVAFNRARAIFTVGVDGGAEPTQVTFPSTDEVDEFAQYSTDGSTVVFTRWDFTDGQTSAIWVVDPTAGPTPVQLTSPSTDYLDTSPVISADGSTVVFTRSEDWLDKELFVISTTPGSTPTQVPAPPARYFSQDISADGSTLVASRATGTIGLVAFSTTGEWDPIQLTTGSVVLGAVISADGSTVFFEQDSNIYAVSADGTSAPVQLTTASAGWAPAISADGSTLVFTRGGAIYAADFGGTALTNLRQLTADYRDGFPEISADGSTVVFERGTEEGSSSIYAVGTDGTSTPIQLSDDTERDFKPSISCAVTS